MPRPYDKPMPDARNDEQIEELFAQADLLLDTTLRFAFIWHHHPPSLEDEQRLKQRIRLLLLEDNYRRLRSYDARRAKLKTWLQSIANHEVGHFLQDESRKNNLEDVPAEMFQQLPAQEASLLDKEQRLLLAKVLSELTPRQRKVFEDWWRGKTTEKSAAEIGIKAASVRRQRDTVKRKIQKLITQLGGRQRKIVL